MKKEYIMAGFTVFCWGTMAPVSKLLLSEMSNMKVLGYGSGIAAIALLIIIFVSGEWKLLKQYSLRDYLYLCFLGFIGYFLYSALYYHGLSTLPSQTACILNYLWPVFTVCFSAIVLKETFSFSKIAALFLSFLGVAVIMFPSGTVQLKGFENLSGATSCILAAVCYALFSVINKKRGGNQMINMFVYIGVSAILGLLCDLKDGFSLPAASQIPGLLWMGIIVNAAGYLLWAMALQKSSTASIANFAYATPAISMVLSAVILHEQIYLSSIMGLVLILGGFFLQMFLEHRKEVRAYRNV